MNSIKKYIYVQKAKRVVEVLNKRRYEAIYVDTLEEAKKLVLESIPKGSSVAMGGSVTLSEMDMINEIRKGEYKFFDRFASGLPFSEVMEIYRQGLTADYFLSSTNVITEDGRLINMDSSGNRAASILFGPKKVIIVAGFNKIVKNVEEGLKRLEEIAPMNCKRLHPHAVCADTGICIDCIDDARMCNYISIVQQGGKEPGRFKIIIVGQDIGF